MRKTLLEKAALLIQEATRHVQQPLVLTLKHRKLALLKVQETIRDVRMLMGDAGVLPLGDWPLRNAAINTLYRLIVRLGLKTRDERSTLAKARRRAAQIRSLPSL